MSNDSFNTTATLSLISVPHVHSPAVVVSLMVSCVIAITSNTSVCYLIISVPRLRTPTNVFILSLCLCNICVSGFLIPMHCFSMNTLAYQYIVLITVLTYIANLTAVTYERLFSITKPFRYKTEMNKVRAAKISLVAWVVPLLYCILPILWRSDTTILVHKVYIMGTLILFLIIPLLFIFFVYVKVFIEIKRMYDYYHTIALEKVKKRKTFPKKVSPTGDRRPWCLLQISNRKRRLCCCFTVWSQPEHKVTQAIVGVTITVVDDSLANEDEKTDRLCPISLVIDPDRSYPNVNHIDIKTEDSKQFLTSSMTTGIYIDDSELLKTNNEISRDERRRKSVSWDPLTHVSLLNPSNPGNTLEEKSKSWNAPLNNSGDEPVKLRKHGSSLKRIRKRLTEHRSSLGRLKQKMNELKASLAFAVVAMTYMFTWLPVIVLNFLDVIDAMQLAPPSLFIFSIYAIAFNSLLDPFLYGFLLKSFRVTIRRIIRKNKCNNICI